MNGMMRFGGGLLLALALMAGAQASSPAEKVVCADPANRSGWLSEARIREIFGEQNYAQAKLKVSRGGCYEFYAVHADGSIVEAYYHPVSGEVVRYNRVEARPGGLDYQTRDPGR